ncbi:hypothetical protein LUZ60_004930 [Juncus effusus]|nr:hypothetical protein LUZ60_004930 [Juncus effusus]
MGCVVSKKAAPVTPVYDSGELLSNTSIWNRQHIDPSQELRVDRNHHGPQHSEEESGKVSSATNGAGSCNSTCTYTISLSGTSVTSHSNSNGSKLLGNLHRYIEGEAVAAGWPSWLSSVAAEAVQGWVPLKVDAYEKLEKIGQGTYSSVFKARELETGRIVALKKVRFDNFEPESVRFMMREIMILRRLNHPNIIKLEGLITSRLSCNIYLVFEYMEHDLAGLTSSPEIKFTESQVKCYMNQLLSGIEHCHTRGVMHRDIKCANVLVSNEGILKIADFGLANFYSPGQQLTSRVVTLWYRPPELLLGSTNYNPSVDLWSVGCVFAEMFIRKPLLQGRTEVEQIHKIFKMCGSHDEIYWRRPMLTHAAVFKPAHPYEPRLKSFFELLPDGAFKLLETLLSVEPAMRGTASAALKSEYFRKKPYACDPASLPKYTPNREMDAKYREDARRRKANSKAAIEASKRLSRANRTSATNVTNTTNQSSGSSYKASVPEETLLTNKEETTETLKRHHHHHQRRSETSRLFVDLNPIPSLKPVDKPVQPAPDPNGPNGPNKYEWAKKRAKELARNTKPHHTSYTLPPLSAGGPGGMMSQHALMKQWAHVDSRDSFNNKKDPKSFKSGILVPNYSDREDKVEYSGPLLSQSRKVDELLMKHEKHIRNRARKTWFQKGKK